MYREDDRMPEWSGGRLVATSVIFSSPHSTLLLFPRCILMVHMRMRVLVATLLFFICSELILFHFDFVLFH